VDGNAAAEIELDRVSAREDLIDSLLDGKSIGYGYRRMNLVQILIEWPGVDIEAPAQKLVQALTAPGDATAKFGDLQIWLRSVAEAWLDAHSERIDWRAQEMIAAAREGEEE
jgi:hypothetical protein